MLGMVPLPISVQNRLVSASRDAPPRVSNCDEYWADPPPTRSARCAWWVERIEAGWRPNRRIATLSYEAAAPYYGVWMWEWIHVLHPLLQQVGSRSD
jgi:hypothetical protein